MNWVTPSIALICAAIAGVMFWQKVAPATRTVLTFIATIGVLFTSGTVADALKYAGGWLAEQGSNLTEKWFSSEFGQLFPAALTLIALLALYLEVAPAKWKGSGVRPSNRTAVIAVFAAVALSLTPGWLDQLTSASGVA